MLKSFLNIFFSQNVVVVTGLSWANTMQTKFGSATLNTNLRLNYYWFIRRGNFLNCHSKFHSQIHGYLKPLTI